MREQIRFHYNPCRFLVVLLLWMALTAAQAQSPATLQAFEKEAHLGSVEDALAGITVVNRSADGSVQTRHGNGLLLRCDGFVLAPEALFYTSIAGNIETTRPNQSITVTLHPGTQQQQTVAGRRPGWFGWVEAGTTRQHLGYAVLKLDNAHCPAMRPLLPDTLAAGDKLTLAWSAWDESKHAFTSVQTRTVSVGTRKSPAPDDKIPPLFREQFTPLSSTQEAVMPGAVLITQEASAAGIIPGNTLANVSRFANFASLSQATNCVTALPTEDNAFIRRNRPPSASDASVSSHAPFASASASPTFPQQTRQTNSAEKRQRDVANSAPDMVSVPGGPVKLPPALMNLQLDMEASRVACVAPFLIDRYEVTNAQYLQFWKSLPDKARANPALCADMYPYGWGKEAEPFPDNLAHVPVLGIRLPGARAYATWAGKRLPTPYEWCLAAFGPTGGNEMPAWGKTFLAQRKEVWNRVAQAHIAYAQAHPGIVPRFIPTKLDARGPQDDIGDPREVEERVQQGKIGVRQDLAHPSVSEFFNIPWFFYNANFQEASAWSKQTVEELTEPLFQEWVDPMYVLPVGSRPYDVSPCGAYDMLTNADELVVPGPIYPWNRPPRADWPVREVDRYVGVQWGIFDAKAFGDLGLRHAEIKSVWLHGARHKWDAPENMKLLGGLQPLLELFSFEENPLQLWAGTSSSISPPWVQDAQLDTPTSFLTEGGNPAMAPYTDHPKYTDHMLSRRLRSASENARPDTLDFAPSDLGPFVIARAAMDEYSELLQPADEMMVSLQPGPTVNRVYYPFMGTILHNWGFVAHPVVERLANGRFRTMYPTPPAWEDQATFVDGTWIAHAGAYPLWRERPRHYHQEMGHPVAEDHDRPANSKYPPNGAKLAPDTFLVAGGFRCAR